MVVRIDLKVEQKRETLCFVLENVFTKKECDDLIALSEKKGYEPALLNIGGGRQTYAPDVRNNDRCIIDDEALAEKLYQKIQPYVPQQFKAGKAVGLNERLRFLRYDPGHNFKAHQDGMYYRNSGPKMGERSYITVQIYLNEGFEGGETTFYRDGENEEDTIPVVPRIGSVLIFQHDMLHEGSLLKAGRKYAIRTDVMYKVPPNPKIKNNLRYALC